MSNKYQEIEESYQTSLASLDEFQRRAVESEAERIVIRAPAGAGKTHLLIAAVCAYRYNNLNDSICAITYTRAAREEMEGRLQKMGVHNVRVSTIHV